MVTTCTSIRRRIENHGASPEPHSRRREVIDMSVNRERPVRKAVSFTDAEWQRVSERMEISRDASFDAFARRACLESEVKVVRQTFDPQALRAELARIGNNVNQVARQANIEQKATAEQVQEVRALMREVQRVVLAEFRRQG